MTTSDFDRFVDLVGKRDEQHAQRQDRFEQTITEAMKELTDTVKQTNISLLEIAAERKHDIKIIQRIEQSQQESQSEIRDLKENILPALDKKVEKNSDIRKGAMWLAMTVIGVVITGWLGMQFSQISQKDDVAAAIESLAKSLEEKK